MRDGRELCYSLLPDVRLGPPTKLVINALFTDISRGRLHPPHPQARLIRPGPFPQACLHEPV